MENSRIIRERSELPLHTINKEDTISDLIDKLNQNFGLIREYQGGRQGIPGVPGLPGCSNGFNYFDETTGLTNLERMQAGKPPIGSDGNPIQLHHILQKEVGPMVEIREITHQEYYSQLHGVIEDGASFRNNPVLNKQYNNFRCSYWKWRAEQIIGGN